MIPPRKVLPSPRRKSTPPLHSLNDADPNEVDFVSLGCPHLSIQEIARPAGLLAGKQVSKEFWITTARPTKHIADRMGYTAIIEASGANLLSIPAVWSRLSKAALPPWPPTAPRPAITPAEKPIQAAIPIL